jgi:hypothetical protein
MGYEDYMTRYLRQIGTLVAALIGFREKKEYQLAIDEIEKTLITWFNTKSEEIENFSDEELANHFENHSKNFENENSIAELFYQKAITLEKIGEKELSKKSAIVSTFLFRLIDKKSGLFSVEIQQRIAELDQIISQTD